MNTYACDVVSSAFAAHPWSVQPTYWLQKYSAQLLMTCSLRLTPRVSQHASPLSPSHREYLLIAFSSRVQQTKEHNSYFQASCDLRRIAKSSPCRTTERTTECLCIILVTMPCCQFSTPCIPTEGRTGGRTKSDSITLGSKTNTPYSTSNKPAPVQPRAHRSQFAK